VLQYPSKKNCTPHVCICAVIGLLAVWWYTKPKTKFHPSVYVPDGIGVLAVWIQNPPKKKKTITRIIFVFPKRMAEHVWDFRIAGHFSQDLFYP